MVSDDWPARVAAAETAFFLDVDGTLLDFKQRPEEVIADEGLRANLDRLHEDASGALALVSGRTIADLDRIMSPLRLPAAGTHGAELRFADGHRELTQSTVLDEVRAVASGFVDEHPALWLEDKGASVAIHYRSAPELSGEVADFLEGLVVQEGLMVQHGKMVVEVKSTLHNKGTAICALMRSTPFAGRQPLFIGDDLTDEHGFAAVNRLDGVSIKVGTGETTAQYRLSSPSEVRALLRQLSTG